MMQELSYIRNLCQKHKTSEGKNRHYPFCTRYAENYQ